MLYNLDDGEGGEESRRPGHSVVIRTFGYFDVFVDGVPIAFRNKKSKELFALLVDRRGGFVTSEEAIGFLWEEEPVCPVTLSRYRKVALRLGYIAAVMILLTVGYWLLVDRGLSLNGFLILLCVGSLLIGFLVVMINVPISTVLMPSACSRSSRSCGGSPSHHFTPSSGVQRIVTLSAALADCRTARAPCVRSENTEDRIDGSAALIAGHASGSSVTSTTRCSGSAR